MTDDPKQKPPATSPILDAVCETLGIYRREDAATVNYDYTWFTSPLAKSAAAMRHTAQHPLLRTLAALMP
ncbi:MAG: hypothetical protein JNK56_13920, partial [Myxococcales bacterium]|nr:hypothetical protein [Myxococcales bacterium]